MENITAEIIIVAVSLAGALVGILKYALPRLIDVHLKQASQKAEWSLTKEQEQWESQRQEQVALWSQTVRLQTEMLNQNKRLIEFITTQVTKDYEGIKETIESLKTSDAASLKAVEQELKSNAAKITLVEKEMINIRTSLRIITSLLKDYDSNRTT